MTGWRIGYAAGPADLIKGMGIIQSHSTTSPSSITQAAAVEALNGPQEAVGKMAKRYEARRNRVVKQINNTPGLHTLSPDGAFYLFVSGKDMLGQKTPQGSLLERISIFVDTF